MVQLNLLSGKKAGASMLARRFPVRVGRSPANDLRLDDEGVWEEHLEISLQQGGFSVKTLGGALTALNGEPVFESVLRNGDTIQLGAAKLQFWLAETRQARLAFREWATWLGIAGISLAQVALVYYLLNL